MSTQEGSTRTPRTFACQRDATRNLVVCIDGTSNQFGTKNTNIVELYSYVTKNDKQLTYYSSGLGTIAKIAGSSLGHQLSNNLDMAAGRNLHKVIMASYRWLSDNYKDGDRIYLFGFSRGAYQVRALAGMIARVGLLLPGNNEQIPFAFELYSKTEDDDSTLTRPGSVINRPVTKKSKKAARYMELAKTFQKTFCRSNVHIHFVGVWDTVSSVGLSRGKTLPCTTTPCEYICYFRHALALDERRVKFLPEYVYGGRSGCGDDGRIKEVWFAGCHADVGGGNRRNEKLQSEDIPLLWMRGQAIAAGLEMEPADVTWNIDDLNKQITSSLNPGWWPLELLPLKHLQYDNLDEHTFRPHLGSPRRIVPGQKVHVSVLFKTNYKPFARFYNSPEKWPEPMFWNDAASHQRLQNLSDLWEKDIFDECSIQMLLDDLRRGQPNLNLLDRLAFMASFDACKEAISNYNDAKQVLASFLRSKDKFIRLSTAVTFCEVGWDWPLETTHSELRQLVTDVSEILEGNSDHRRVCMYMPSLCKRDDLKAGLISDQNLRKMVKLCDSRRIVEDDERTSTVAFYSAQALSMLMKLDGELAQPLIAIDAVTDITVALRSNSNPALVSLLTVLDGLAKHKKGRETMRAGPALATLLKLVKQFDDFVAPAATRVLCSLLPEGDLRDTMLQFDVLSIFLDMLGRCSDETKLATCKALAQFAQYGDIQRVLSEDGYLLKLAERAQSQAPRKRDGAILALVTLGNTEGPEVRTVVAEAIKAAKTIPAIVARLRRKSTALSAASALAHLVKIDDVAVMVSDEKAGACMGIVGMLQHRWFDGMRGEDGLQVLSELLDCEPLRSAVLKAGAINTLREMIGCGNYGSAHAGLHYLGVIAGFDKGENALPSREETLGLVPPILSTLRIQHRGVQRIAVRTLQCLSAEEELRVSIVDNLLGLLRDRHASVLFATSTVLGLLATDKSVRDRILLEEAFWHLSHDYNGGLTLEYDEQGKGPRTGEVYESVGRLIKLTQVSERDDDVGATAGGLQDEKGEEQERKRWPVRVPYVLEKGNRPGV